MLGVISLGCAPISTLADSTNPPAVVFMGTLGKEDKKPIFSGRKTILLRWADGVFTWEGSEIKSQEIGPYVTGLLKAKNIDNVTVVIVGHHLTIQQVIGVLDQLHPIEAKFIGFILQSSEFHYSINTGGILK